MAEHIMMLSEEIHAIVTKVLNETMADFIFPRGKPQDGCSKLP
jgi:hypothetical protein